MTTRQKSLCFVLICRWRHSEQKIIFATTAAEAAMIVHFCKQNVNTRERKNNKKYVKMIWYFFRWANLGLFLQIFVLFKHKFYGNNFRLQQDSNSYCQNRRQACCPLDHLHGPIFRSLVVCICMWKLRLRKLNI